MKLSFHHLFHQQGSGSTSRSLECIGCMKCKMCTCLRNKCSRSLCIGLGSCLINRNLDSLRMCLLLSNSMKPLIMRYSLWDRLLDVRIDWRNSSMLQCRVNMYSLSIIYKFLQDKS